MKVDKKIKLLDSVKPVSEIEDKMTMLVYGRSGTGKTTLAGTFPTPILLVDVQEEGVGPLRKIKGIDVLEVDEWAVLNNLPYEIEGTKYKSVIIDSISMVQTLRVQTILKSSGKTLMTQQNWGEVAGDLQRFILTLRELSQHLLFIAHDRTMNASDESVDQLDPEVGPALIPSVSRVICGAVNIVGNAFIKEVKTKDGAKINREMQYRLRLGPHAYYITKVRTPSPEKVPSSLLNPTFDKIVKIVQGD